MILCVIPCRKGSKRLPGKNFKLFNGKPLVEWTLEQAREIELFDKIVLSSDDHLFGEYPEFEKRPGVYATDSAPIQAEITRLWLKYKPDILVMLQVTTPQRTMGDIASAGHAFVCNDLHNSLVSIGPDNKPNGTIFMTRTGVMYDPPILLYRTKDFYIDIDYDYDFKIAEALCK